MIGKLRGVVDSYGDDTVVLDVHGVGYLVHCSARTLQSLPSPGEAATISIETWVREDQIRLYGFAGDLERNGSAFSPACRVSARKSRSRFWAR